MKNVFYINGIEFLKSSDDHYLTLDGSLEKASKFLSDLLGFSYGGRNQIIRNKFIGEVLGGVPCVGHSPQFESLDDLNRFIEFCNSLNKRKIIDSKLFKI